MVFDYESQSGKELWKVREQPPFPRFPAGLIQKGISACVFVAFVVKPDGSVSQPRILRFKSNAGDQSRSLFVAKQVAGAVFESLGGLRFDPGPANQARKHGFTGFQFTFNAPNTRVGKQECAIADLAAFLAGDNEERGTGKPAPLAD